MKTIVVLGATGNLGAYIAVDLQKHGYKVIAAGHRISDNGFFATKGIEYVSLDITDKKSFEKLPQKDVYGVAHFAGELPSRYDYKPDRLVNSIVIGTLNVLDYMTKSGARKIVFPQTPFDLHKYHNTKIAIEPDMPRTFPLTGDHSIYTIAKNAAVDLIEHYAATYNILWYVLRFFTVYEYHPNPYHYSHYKRQMMPYRILIDKAMKGEPIEIWGDPSRRKEFVYIKDFVQCVRKAFDRNGSSGIYNVGGKETVSLDEQIRGIIDVFSPSNNRSSIFYRPDMPNALEAHFNMDKTRKELGYVPQYSYLEAMKDLYDEMKKEPFAQLWGKGKDYI